MDRCVWSVQSGEKGSIGRLGLALSTMVRVSQLKSLFAGDIGRLTRDCTFRFVDPNHF